jgi:hypothetical protein
VQRPAAAGACRARRLDHHLDPGQVIARQSRREERDNLYEALASRRGE